MEKAGLVRCPPGHLHVVGVEVVEPARVVGHEVADGDALARRPLPLLDVVGRRVVDVEQAAVLRDADEGRRDRLRDREHLPLAVGVEAVPVPLAHERTVLGDDEALRAAALGGGRHLCERSGVETDLRRVDGLPVRDRPRPVVHRLDRHRCHRRRRRGGRRVLARAAGGGPVGAAGAGRQRADDQEAGEAARRADGHGISERCRVR
jgi:hypothetical protein